MKQEIYRSGCWGCLKARQDPSEKYVCPKVQKHWKDWEKQEKEQF